MSIIIREARLEDSAAIAQLSVVELGYTDLDPDTLRAQLSTLLLSERDGIFVAERGGQAVGYIHLTEYLLLYYPLCANVMGLAVASSSHRMGIGGALLERGEEWARERGAQCVRLNSGSGRTGAHEFYRTRGYEEKDQKRFTKQFQRISD